MKAIYSGVRMYCAHEHRLHRVPVCLRQCSARDSIKQRHYIAYMSTYGGNTLGMTRNRIPTRAHMRAPRAPLRRRRALNVPDALQVPASHLRTARRHNGGTLTPSCVARGVLVNTETTPCGRAPMQTQNGCTHRFSVEPMRHARETARLQFLQCRTDSRSGMGAQQRVPSGLEVARADRRRTGMVDTSRQTRYLRDVPPVPHAEDVIPYARPSVVTVFHGAHRGTACA